MVHEGYKLKINRPKDLSNLTEDEKEHLPLIKAPDEVVEGNEFEVTVNVGHKPHPMKEEHYIEWIQLYFNGELVEEKTFTPNDEKAEAKFKVYAKEDIIAAYQFENCYIHGYNVCGECDGKVVATSLTALGYCNTHGLWEETRGIEVVSKDVGEGRVCTWTHRF
ncbi:Desulfoferrodoxin ferrous iron-binding region [Methanohalobium evestigatum Z-7303]|uniref:Desulfoferrodoxin ferrous iron-binding region n=1 Tax=Methanohalobium evestigatum (strain ATCC BAA-1072 / DSM 3721 / NBRC 107634 / OCM 161 / Z-7303) TaxID=644295 RepID=D7E9D2_METEZ|nr:desulfoferrodoxin family protein [Methanohalobium evestigatum]ADI74204.1 Desulfoferrodoxin ferrous iron-binding region [Methanohalobium evestigatum Z-7303]